MVAYYQKTGMRSIAIHRVARGFRFLRISGFFPKNCRPGIVLRIYMCQGENNALTQRKQTKQRKRKKRGK
jgi:hypothetical protein